MNRVKLPEPVTFQYGPTTITCRQAEWDVITVTTPTVTLDIHVMRGGRHVTVYCDGRPMDLGGAA